MSIYKICALFVWRGGSDVINTHHYEFAGIVPDAGQLQTFIDEFDGHYKTVTQARTRPEMDLTGYEVRRVDVANQPATVLTPTDGVWNGTSTGNQQPPQITPIVTWRAFTTFPRTSRVYMPNVTTNQSGLFGELTSNHQAALTSFANNLLEISYGGSSTAKRVAVKYSSSPYQVSASNVLTDVVVGSTYGTQRDRIPGRGS